MDEDAENADRKSIMIENNNSLGDETYFVSPQEDFFFSDGTMS